MDYFELLHKAQMNNKNVSVKETRCYKSTFTAPKKCDKGRVSSTNVQRFLARKEVEEQLKQKEAQKKKEELLALRSLDKKAQKRVQTMLKRTKSANKSVMADAIDNYNTKDTLEGPKQCDEDDYGYVSQEASAFYEKMMAKYEQDPVDKLKQMTREVKDLKAAKDRVKAALDREAEEQLNPVRKRKRKHGDSSLGDDDEEDTLENNEDSKKILKEEESHESKEKPKKIQKKMPPPVDFFELMKIAAQKQHEPILIEKKVEEPERPLTMKEKLERQKEMERKNKKVNPKVQSSNKSTTSTSKEELSSKPPAKTSGKIVSQKSESSKSKSIVKNKNDLNGNTKSVSHSTPKKEVKFSSVVEKSPILSSSLTSTSKPLNDKSRNSDLKLKPTNTVPPNKNNSKNDVEMKKSSPKVDVSDIDKEIEMLMKKKRMLMQAAKSQESVKKPNQAPHQKESIQKPPGLPSKVNSNHPLKKPLMDAKTNNSHKESAIDREKLHLKANSKSIEQRSIPQTNQPLRKLPPSSDPSRKPSALSMKKKKRVIDSESEYDSEMDDFIDDNDDYVDYSQHIKEIFGYDKSRYSNVPDEECEESSFRTQMIEERRSARIGLMEDLEDIQREKEEKARAKARKKMMKR